MMIARHLMTADPITIAPDTPFLEIQHLFVVAQIGGAPVVNDRGVVVGMISSVDLLRAVDQACDDDIDEQPTAVSDGDSKALPEQFGLLVASDLATPEVVWVATHATSAEVAHVMREAGVHRVLVGDDGRLEGIVTAFDLLQEVKP